MEPLIRERLGAMYSAALGNTALEPFSGGYLTARSGFVVCNSGANYVYVGTDNTVTSSGLNAEFCLAPYETKLIPYPDDSLWLVAAGTGSQVRAQQVVV